MCDDNAGHLTATANRLHSGDWVVDKERTVWTDGVADALVAYEVRDGLIQTMVMLGGPV